MKRLLADLTVSVALFLMTAFSGYAQKSIAGTVMSENEPVAGALVYIEGTSSGATTDLDGRFTLSVPAGSILCVECLGFKPYSAVVESDRTDWFIELEVDRQVLDDVIVVGYGSMKKSDLTGSVASVKMEALHD
ncbi:MAG: carboxypeptidase-like regulatory domain-containing protein, partial [Bacteroidales bacterium]|nr:carboxypeptidase-like regulatory domain-containing protein [Bacteroidales bacterium]